MCAYFVCVLSVLYTMSVLILHRESFLSSAITPWRVLIPQNVAHASESKGCACVMRTWPRFATERKKKNQAGISTRAFPLESPSNKTCVKPIRYVLDQLDEWQLIQRFPQRGSCELKFTPIASFCNVSTLFLILSLIAHVIYDFFLGWWILRFSFVNKVDFTCR